MSKKERITQEERNRRAAITAAVEVKMAFEMYAYRIIDHETFSNKMKETAQVMLYSMKPEKETPEVDPAQLTIV